MKTLKNKDYISSEVTCTMTGFFLIVAILLVIAMFVFVMFYTDGGNNRVYAGSVGENMSKYDCINNHDACNMNNISEMKFDV